MRVEPLDVAPVVARLQDVTLCPALRFVGRAVDNQNAIDEGPKVSPAAFVLEANYRADASPANAGGGLLVQSVRWQIPVLVCVRSYGEATGTRASDECRAARKEIWTALVGFDPTAAKDGFAIQADSGRLVAYRNSTFYFVDVYRLQTQIRNVES